MAAEQAAVAAQAREQPATEQMEAIVFADRTRQ